MGKYGYDETQYLSTEAEAIDKDGFHKKVDIGSSSSDEIVENIWMELIEPSDNGLSDRTVILELILDYSDESDEYFNNVIEDPFATQYYYYYGEQLFNESDLVIEMGEYGPYISNANEMGLYEPNKHGVSTNVLMKATKKFYKKEYYVLEDNETLNMYEPWGTDKLTIVFVGWDEKTNSGFIKQCHQR